MIVRDVSDLTFATFPSPKLWIYVRGGKSSVSEALRRMPVLVRVSVEGRALPAAYLCDLPRHRWYRVNLMPLATVVPGRISRLQVSNDGGRTFDTPRLGFFFEDDGL